MLRQSRSYVVCEAPMNVPMNAPIAAAKALFCGILSRFPFDETTNGAAASESRWFRTTLLDFIVGPHREPQHKPTQPTPPQNLNSPPHHGRRRLNRDVVTSAVHSELRFPHATSLVTTCRRLSRRLHRGARCSIVALLWSDLSRFMQQCIYILGVVRRLE